jgi:hypothetical protein
MRPERGEAAAGQIAVTAAERGEMGETLIAALSLTDPKAALEELHTNEVWLKEAERIAHLGSWERDFTNNHVLLSDELRRIPERGFCEPPGPGMSSFPLCRRYENAAF